MNTVLPVAIETYLKEANFSSTEMLILRKLLEEDAVTLRELASKTGKSTGVLDIAMKKLLRKGIAQRTVINGTMRYCIDSLDSVAAWVKHDMEEKQREMKRKHQSFEYFIASLKVDKKRPDMQHFTGREGLEQAYSQLLESGKELLTVTPILYRAEDDPLRDFKVEYFKKRQARRIFQRVIAPDSPLSRRYQSRDMFEYRHTALLPSADFSISFERTVVGDTVACFNFQDETACLLKYPDLASAEHATFENLWAHAMAREEGRNEPLTTPLPAVKSSIPLATRFGSRFRQFFLSQKSMLLLAAFGLIAIAVSVGLSRHAESISLARLQDHLKSVAGVGALHFNPDDIVAVRGPEDIATPAYARLVATLNLIRRTDPSIRYAYIMRRTDDPTKLAFVADADSLNPAVPLDLDQSGSIGPEDELSYPGDLYDIAEQMYMHDAFQEPIADPTPIEDQWGTFVSGMAPIVDDRGNAIAVLGIDMQSERLSDLRPSVSMIFLLFGILFIVVTLIRFGLSNRELMQDLWEAMREHLRLIVLIILFVILATYGAVMLYQWQIRQLKIEETGKRLMAIAATAAGEFDVADLDQLRWARDMKTEAYQRVFQKLNEIRNKNPEVKWAYIMRATADEHLFIFVVDADSNWYAPEHVKPYGDFSDFSEADENVAPGVRYMNTGGKIHCGRPCYSHVVDQWGTFVTGAAPIRQGVYFLGLDIDLFEINRK